MKWAEPRHRPGRVRRAPGAEAVLQIVEAAPTVNDVRWDVGGAHATRKCPDVTDDKYFAKAIRDAKRHEEKHWDQKSAVELICRDTAGDSWYLLVPTPNGVALEFPETHGFKDAHSYVMRMERDLKLPVGSLAIKTLESQFAMCPRSNNWIPDPHDPTKPKRFPVLRLYFDTPHLYRKVVKYCETTEVLGKDKFKYKVSVWETKDYVKLEQRFLIENELVPCGWIRAGHLRPLGWARSLCDHERTCLPKHIAAISEDEALCRTTKISIDLEVRNGTTEDRQKGRGVGIDKFPKAEDPTNQIIQASVVVDTADGRHINYLLELDDDGAKVGDRAVETRTLRGGQYRVVYFQAEIDLIVAIRDLIVHHDADIVTTFNGNGFDWPYLFGRAGALKAGDPNGRLYQLGRVITERYETEYTYYKPGAGEGGRDQPVVDYDPDDSDGATEKLPRKHFHVAQLALEKGVVLTPVMKGRILLDMCEHIKKDISIRLPSYTLDACAKKVLKEEGKMTFDHNDIFDAWSGLLPANRLIQIVHGKKDGRFLHEPSPHEDEVNAWFEPMAGRPLQAFRDEVKLKYDAWAAENARRKRARAALWARVLGGGGLAPAEFDRQMELVRVIKAPDNVFGVPPEAQRRLLGDYCIVDSRLPLRMMEVRGDVMFVWQVSRVACTNPNAVINGGQMARVSAMFIREAWHQGRVVNRVINRAMPYQGATVLPPKRGFYGAGDGKRRLHRYVHDAEAQVAELRAEIAGLEAAVESKAERKKRKKKLEARIKTVNATTVRHYLDAAEEVPPDDGAPVPPELDMPVPPPAAPDGEREQAVRDRIARFDPALLAKHNVTPGQLFRMAWSVIDELPEGYDFAGMTVREVQQTETGRVVLTLDFKSLYPSIMLSHSLCPSTLFQPDEPLTVSETYAKQYRRMLRRREIDAMPSLFPESSASCAPPELEHVPDHAALLRQSVEAIKRQLTAMPTHDPKRAALLQAMAASQADLDALERPAAAAADDGIGSESESEDADDDEGVEEDMGGGIIEDLDDVGDYWTIDIPVTNKKGYVIAKRRHKFTKHDRGIYPVMLEMLLNGRQAAKGQMKKEKAFRAVLQRVLDPAMALEDGAPLPAETAAWLDELRAEMGKDDDANEEKARAWLERHPELEEHADAVIQLTSTNIAIFDGRQKALKVMANSIYGVSGAKQHSPCACCKLAETVTAIGRQMIEKSKHAAEVVFAKYGCRVIYGDTDSIFVLIDEPDDKEAWRIAIEIAEYITKVVFKGTVQELEAEALKRAFALFKKKTYVALQDEGHGYEHAESGISTVRRDKPDVLNKLVSRLTHAFTKLAYFPKETIAKVLIGMCVDHLHHLEADELPLEDYQIIQRINKLSTRSPHIVVARELEALSGLPVLRGDAVTYVHVIDPSKKLVADRVKSPMVIKADPDRWKVDRAHYLRKKLPIVRSTVSLFVPEEVIDKMFDTYQRALDDPMMVTLDSWAGSTLTPAEQRRQNVTDALDNAIFNGRIPNSGWFPPPIGGTKRAAKEVAAEMAERTVSLSDALGLEHRPAKRAKKAAPPSKPKAAASSSTAMSLDDLFG